MTLVRGKEPPPSLLVASSGSEAERRTSKRARRASATSGGRILLNVSGDTTIFQLKLQIWESLEVRAQQGRLDMFQLECEVIYRIMLCNLKFSESHESSLCGPATE